MIREIKSVLLKNEESENQREQIECARTLQDLGLSFQDAVQILSENSIPLILGEEDKVITQREGEFEGLEDLILIHLTRFPPTGCKIKSPKEAEALRPTMNIELDGKTYEYRIPYMRDTVHFTVNNEVNSDHGLLNCDDCKYAVLIPMKDIPKQNLKGEANDMYTINGGPTITSNSYILCVKGYGEVLRQNNPGVSVIECEGESVRDYSRAFLSTIGYKQRDTGFHSFVNKKDTLNFFRIMNENAIPLDMHFYSKEKSVEHAYGYFDIDLAIYKIIKENS